MAILKSVFLFSLILLPASADPSIWDTLKKDCAAVPAITEALGAELSVIDSYIRRSLIRTDTPFGFRIAKVGEKSPAAVAGWKKGDLLLYWKGESVKSTAMLLKRIKAEEGGTEIPFECARRKKGAFPFSRKPWERVKGSIVLK